MPSAPRHPCKAVLYNGYSGLDDEAKGEAHRSGCWSQRSLCIAASGSAATAPAGGTTARTTEVESHDGHRTRVAKTLSPGDTDHRFDKAMCDVCDMMFCRSDTLCDNYSKACYDCIEKG